MDKEFISFDIKTGMKNIIGRDLITDDYIAIYELVKNSYDAYADYVTLTFNKDEIIIADNGKGMSESDLRLKWFAVAFSAKKDGSEDNELTRGAHLNNLKSRRFYAGAKGVGRFSCDRLGNSLELTTTDFNFQQTCKVQVNWKLFEIDPRQSFGAIEIPFEKTDEIVSYNNNKSHGTILRISKLNSEWTEQKLIGLKHSLEKLINPFSNQSDFKIEIIAPDFLEIDRAKTPFQRVNGVITNSILSVLDIKTTQIIVKVKDEKITTKITDRGTLIYHIEENNSYFKYLNDLDINLYFLNRSAKINFGKIMDTEPVNYGNVLLFKNGFRVQPYGQFGDDSWKIDQRKQQGYNRFLGTRDLFGRVDLITNNFDEFKEVSSRDGGLVETVGKKLLFELFTEKALKRLERYVVGVLWGEGFKKKNYFINDEIAQQHRDKLEDDKDRDNYDEIKGNIGSKIDFVNLIKSLSDDKEVKIIAYNKELVDLVNAQLDIVQPKFISDLGKIAEKTNDIELLNQIKLTEENFDRLIQEKDEANKRADIEEQLKIDAEKKAKEEEYKRIEAEKRQKEEEERRHKAELETANKEKERALAELAKLKAEQKAKEEKEKNKDLTDKLSLETKKNQYLNATRKTLSDDAEQLVHSIDLYVGNASTYINELMTSNIDEEIKSKVYAIKSNIDKAIKVSQIIIKSNFDYKYTDQRVNLPKYISEYLEDLAVSYKNVKINTVGLFDKFVLINPIEIDIILDNLVSNSKKAQAKNILVEFIKNQNSLEIHYSDDGSGMSELLTKNPDAIFDLGVRDSKEKGSGIGMFDVSKRLKGLKGSITFVGNNKKLKGACFKIII